MRDSVLLAAPDLILPECCNVVWKKLQRRELSWEEAQLAAALLPHASLQVHSSGVLMGEVLAMARHLDHPAYDCLYLVLAFRLDTQLVTADRQFLRRLNAVRNPGRAFATAL